MEVIKDYKQTVIGAIPDDWSIGTIDDYTLKVGSGITPKGGSTVYKEFGRPFVRSQNIGWGELKLVDIAYIDEETHASFVSSEIKLNDVLLNISGASIGRCSIANPSISGGNVNQHVCIIRTKDSTLYPLFLNYVLLSSIGQSQINSFQSGGNREGLNFEQIKSFRIPLPPTIIEQVSISNALFDTDAWIQSLISLIAKKQNIKQGVIQALLNPYEGGKLKKSWESKKLSEIADVIKGSGLSKGKLTINGKCPCLLYGELFTSYQEVIKNVNNSTNFHEGVASKYGDILFPGSTTTSGIDLAKSSTVLIDNVLLGGDILIVRQKIKYNSEFVSYYLNNFCNHEIAKKTRGTTIHHLYGGDLLDIKVNLPSLREQNSTANTLSNITSEITALKAKLDKAKQVKQGMMQNLLTGKIRLV